jgi:site-specific DNA-methyltransferase (adenine-specific)
MDPYYDDGGVTIYNARVEDVLSSVESGSVSLWLTDPPYYRVKNQWWDRQWDSPAAFLDFLRSIVEEVARTLTGNGSLYMFASPKMNARVEMMIAERLNVLNNIRWTKWDGWHQKAKKEELRSYLSPWEAVIFAEHYGSDNAAMGAAGYSLKCDELRGFVFEPLRAYLSGEWKRAGLKNEQANEACGTASMAARHYFSRSQWCLPTAEHYASLQAYANRFQNGSGPEYLRRDYEYLRRDYEELRRDYEELRRPFNATRRHAWDDLWTFPPVQHYEGKHPCEKPVEMLRQIVEVSSRPGDMVFDGFMGSGRLAEVCKATGRRFIGAEVEERWCERAAFRLERLTHDLFAPAPPPFVQATLGF